MKTQTGLAAAGLVVSLVLASDARVAPVQTAAAGPLVTITYEGTLETSWEPIMKQPDGRNIHRATYAWVLTWSGTLGDLEQQPTQKLDVGKLTGTVTYIDNTSAEKASCTGGYKPKVKTITFTASPNTGQGTLTLNLRVPVSTEFLQPTNTTSLFEFCSEVVRWAIPANELVRAFAVDVRKGGRVGREVTLGPLGVNRERGHLDHTVTVTVGDSSGAGVGFDVKAAARRDLRVAVERAKGPCLQLAIGLGVLASGAVWTSAAATIPGGIPAGGAVITTGSIMSAAMSPICGSLVEQIVIDYSIVKRDPPVSLAPPPLHLPSCARWQGGLRAYCTRLGTAVRSLAAAEHDVTLALARLQKAAARLAAARKSGKAAAVTSAEAGARKELASVAAARGAARAAGKKVEGIVRLVRVEGALTAAETGKVVDVLLARLAKRGVPAGDLRTVAPAALRPVATDVLVALTR